jgi:membrane associated rhomboid family serine protease
MAALLMPTLRSRLARVPVTTALVALVVVVSLAGLFWPAFEALLERNPTLILQGQWWRLLTQLFVQKHGWSQFLFNVFGLALLCAVVELRMRRAVVLVTFLAAGVGSAVLLGILQPSLVDAGTSDSVAGFVGLLAVLSFRRSPPQSLPVVPFAYSAFFAVYLTAIDLLPLAVALTVASALTGLLTGLRLGRSPRADVLSLVVIVAATVVLCVERDGHGFGLAIGLLLGFVATQLSNAVLSRRAVPAQPRSRRR